MKNRAPSSSVETPSSDLPPAEPSQKRRVSIGRWSLLALLYTALAVASTWPFASHLGEGIPLGTERVATVPLFNLWTLAWNVESAERGFDGYWQAPIFHPSADTFAFSEPQPVLGLLAFGLCRLGATMAEAYGLLLLGALALNGLLAAALLRRIGLAWLPSVVGGILVLILPFTHQEMGVLQLVPLAGILAFALAVLRFATVPGPRAGAALGAALALAYGLSSQVAVFGALIAVPAAGWLWWPHRKRRQAWAGLAVGVGLFFVLVSPLLHVQMRSTTEEGFSRSTEVMRKHSAKPEHYLQSPWPLLVPTPGIETAERPSSRAFWPGTVRVLLAILAILVVARSPRWRHLGVAGVLVLTCSVIFSFGGHLGIGGLSLPDALRPLPGLGQIRSFFRFALFAQLAVVLLAAGALHWLQDVSNRRLTGGQRSRSAVARILIAAVALLAVAEMWPRSLAIEPLPPLDLDLPWLAWIEEKTATDDVLAFLPFPQGRNVGDYLGTGHWMFWQQRHWRPMVNGYSGFFPRRFQALKKTMIEFPSSEALGALREAGVRYCVVPRSVIEASPAPEADSPVRLKLVFRDEEHELAIFELYGETTSEQALSSPAEPTMQ